MNHTFNFIFFSVDCVKLLGSEVGKTIHHPSACGVEVSGNKHGK